MHSATIKVSEIAYFFCLPFSYIKIRFECNANVDEVIVQRLNWQNLWIHPPPAENVKVRGIDWRPDERILAIGYSNGLVTLIDVENQQEIHKINLDSDITSLAWTQNTNEYQDGTEDSQDNRMVN